MSRYYSTKKFAGGFWSPHIFCLLTKAIPSLIKKKIKFFFIYKEIQTQLGAKSYMRKLVTYFFAPNPLNFLI